MSFAIKITPYAKRFSDFFQNQSRSPKYHLQMLFNDLMLTRNINWVKSWSMSACQAVSDPRLSKILLSVESWFCWFLWDPFKHARCWISQWPKNKSCSLSQTLQLCFSDLLHARSLTPSSNLVKQATFKWWYILKLWHNDQISPSPKYQSCSWWYSKHV